MRGAIATILLGSLAFAAGCRALDATATGAPAAPDLPADEVPRGHGVTPGEQRVFHATDDDGARHPCPAEGSGGAEAALNLCKNRVDVPAHPVAVTQAALRALPIDVPDDAREGTPVTVEGFFVDRKSQAGESANCHHHRDQRVPDDERDTHLFLAESTARHAKARRRLRSGSIVVEVTPRVRADHPGWTGSALGQLVEDGARVRVTGWLTFDPEHASQLGKTRATLWEVHPITTIEIADGTGWRAL
ncbi:MAG: hypothetical protein NVS3B10_10040 [Polyangiales bacterium]